MQRNIFTQIVVYVAAVILITMFFFPNYLYVTKAFKNLELINMLLLIGLYLKDMFRSS